MKSCSTCLVFAVLIYYIATSCTRDGEVEVDKPGMLSEGNKDRSFMLKGSKMNTEEKKVLYIYIK